MIRLITIDFWDTIALNNHDWDKAILEKISPKLIALESGCTVTEIAHAFDLESEHFTHVLVTDSVTLSNRSRVNYLAALLKISLAEHRLTEFAQLIDSQILNPLPTPTKHVDKFLASLHSLGLPVCLISNTGWFSGKAISDALSYLGLSGFLHKMIFSDEFGSAKPSPDIFWSATSSFGCLPSEAVHIGDKVSTDIVGALHAGIRPIHFSQGTGSTTDLCPSFDDYEDVLTYVMQDVIAGHE